MGLEQYEDAIKMFDIAIRINPRSAMTYLGKGKVLIFYDGVSYQFLGNIDNAFIMYDAAI